MNINVNNLTITLSYTEPNQSADGSTLTDLKQTSIYYNIGAGAVKAIDIPATSKNGGGAISQDVSIPINLGQEVDVLLYATATDESGNESIPSMTLTVRIDRLAPASPQ